MDQKLDQYRQLIRMILTEKKRIANLYTKDNETVTVFDEGDDIYLLHNLGWYGIERVWKTRLFVRILDGKIWIEEDWTQDGIATDLLEGGVSKDEIVLAFHHPTKRPYTEFAVA